MTASYGSGEVTIALSTVGNVAVSNVRPVPALIPRIRFDLSWTLHHALSLEEGHPGEEFVLTDFPGQLTVGPDNLFVGNLVDRFRSSVTYSHAASRSEGWAGVGERARRRLRSQRVNFHSKGEAICW